MSNFHFQGSVADPSDIAARRRAFQALPAAEQAKTIAQFEMLRAAAAAVRARHVEAQTMRALRAAQTNSAV